MRRVRGWEKLLPFEPVSDSGGRRPFEDPLLNNGNSTLQRGWGKSWGGREGHTRRVAAPLLVQRVAGTWSGGNMRVSKKGGVLISCPGKGELDQTSWPRKVTAGAGPPTSGVLHGKPSHCSSLPSPSDPTPERIDQGTPRSNGMNRWGALASSRPK